MSRNESANEEFPIFHLEAQIQPVGFIKDGVPYHNRQFRLTVKSLRGQELIASRSRLIMDGPTLENELHSLIDEVLRKAIEIPPQTPPPTGTGGATFVPDPE